MLLPCPLCSRQLWHTENGLANHVWHNHPESKICMAHGNAVPYARRSRSRAVLAECYGNVRTQAGSKITPR
jgi:hypothetical protein